MTYVDAPQPVTEDGWLEALRAGKSFITNGPLIDLRVDGHGPGAVIDPDGRAALPVHVRCVSRNDFGALEIVRNGEVIAAEPAKRNSAFEAAITVDVDVADPVWIAARVTPFEGSYDKPETQPVGFNEYGKPIFAHTSPVYVDVAGKGVFQREAAESLMAEVEESRSLIRAIGIYHHDSEQTKVLAIYGEAIAVLREMIKAH